MVRQPVSDLHAVTDGKFTMGVVPVEKDDGMQAYRLLVCENASSYSESMLADSNRCKVALTDSEGNEVVLLPDHLRRDFATKYKGRTKLLAGGAFVIAPTALVGYFGGSWGIKRLTKIGREVSAVVRLKTAKKASPYHLANYETTLNNYRSMVDFQQAESLTHLPVQRVKDLEESRREAVQFAMSAINLDALHKHKEFIVKYRGLPQAQRAKFLTDSASDVDSLRNMPLRESDQYVEEKAEFAKWMKENPQPLGGNEKYLKVAGADDAYPNDFSQSFERLYRIYEASSQKMVGESPQYIDNLERHANLLASRKYLDNLSTDLEIKYKDGMLRRVKSDTTDDTLGKLIAEVDGYIGNAKQELLEKEKAREYVFGRPRDLTGVEAASWGGVVIAGVTASEVVNGMQAFTAINESIWGYGDRQANKYWSQIFHTEDNFANATPVNGLKDILKSLAVTFGFEVNKEILATWFAIKRH